MRHVRIAPSIFSTAVSLAFLLLVLTSCERLEPLAQNNAQLSSQSTQPQLPAVAPFDISFSEFK